MLGSQLTLGVFAALAVAGVALPGNSQWPGADGDATGVGAHGDGGQGGNNNGGWGDARGDAGQGFGSGMGAEGTDGQGNNHGASHDGGDRDQGRNGGGSGGSSTGRAHRRHEGSDASGGMGASGGRNQNGDDGMSGTGGNGGGSWDHQGNDAGKSGDRGDHGGHGAQGGGAGGSGGGVRARRTGAWGEGHQNGNDGMHGNGADAGSSWGNGGSDAAWPKDGQDKGGQDGQRGTADRPGGGIRARDDQQEEDTQHVDNGPPADIDVNAFNRRWAQALEDDDAPDVRFTFDSDHPNAQVSTLHTRSGIGMYECMHTMFTAPCVFKQTVENQCYNRTYDENGSMAPDKGLDCSLYETLNCNMGHTQAAGGEWRQLDHVVYPGIAVYQNYTDFQLLGMHIKGPMSWRCTFLLQPMGKKNP